MSQAYEGVASKGSLGGDTYRYLPRAFPLVVVYIFASGFHVFFVYNCRALEFGLLSGRIPFLCYSVLSGKLF